MFGGGGRRDVPCGACGAKIAGRFGDRVGHFGRRRMRLRVS